MRTVTATEAKQEFAKVMEAAAKEPVVITRQKRDIAVIVSAQEYERLTRLNVAEFQRFCDQAGERAKNIGLTEAKLAELLADD